MSYGYGLGVYFADYNDPDDDGYEHICEYCEAELPESGDVVFEVDGSQTVVFTCPECGRSN